MNLVVASIKIMNERIFEALLCAKNTVIDCAMHLLETANFFGFIIHRTSVLKFLVQKYNPVFILIHLFICRSLYLFLSICSFVEVMITMIRCKVSFIK